ncbi:hypothetical protein CIB87_10615 [Priestia megaterium]|uniref:Uncharacterized protein n=1 Tax=Priestia megaterium TaxID=1404 RepID=A0AA86LVM4_PRIMG|nr:hypothetical protein [Priestia megaterium]AXI29441.1 hypothetical protein CIB87_10615 [Priestia megaterium]
MSLFNDMISKLTDLFTKNENSNIGKIIRIVSDEFTAVQTALETTEEWRDIDKAEGTTLDLIGENIGQPRSKTDDEEFRLLIKTKIFSNLSIGDIDSVNQLLRIHLGEQFVSVQEGWNLDKGTPFDGEAATLFITVKGDGNTRGLPFENTSRIVASGVGTQWDYIFERSLMADRSYNRWVFPYENFTGEHVAGSEDIVSNGNVLYERSFEVSSSYAATQQDYRVVSQSEVIGENTNKLYQAALQLSSTYAATVNDYQVCGGLEENQTRLYQAGINCQVGYSALLQAYPICGETYAEGVN